MGPYIGCELTQVGGTNSISSIINSPISILTVSNSKCVILYIIISITDNVYLSMYKYMSLIICINMYYEYSQESGQSEASRHCFSVSQIYIYIYMRKCRILTIIK